MGKEGNHTEVAGDGEDIDRGGRLLADVDALVADVVAHCECCCDADPAGKQQTRILEPATEGKGREGEVGVYHVDSEEANDGSLRGIIDEPSRH